MRGNYNKQEDCTSGYKALQKSPFITRRTHTHELGRFGQGSIDLQCGNLMFESEDFAWAGNRMPVTIKHLYNSALYAYQYTANSGIKLSAANFSAMKLGLGYKLNIMQSMMATTFQHEGESHIGYVYIGENGEETYFKKSEEQVCCDSNSQCYNLYEDVNSGDMLYDPVELTLKQGEETYQFDSMGRLVRIMDAAGNHMDITYTSNRITSITDGAGRDFSFAYNNSGFLTSITAPDETSILYTYSGNLLSTITYQDSKKVSFTYSSGKPTAVTLLDANGNNVYKVAYSYSGNRLYSVTEYGVENGAFVQGAKSTYSYSVASGRTLVQTTEQMDADEGECYDNVIKTVYTFDDEGNIVSEYLYSEDTGNTGVEGEESGIHPHSGDSGAGIVSNINNLLIGHNFENLSYWYSMPCNCSGFTVSNYSNDSYSKFGGKTCWIRNYGQDDLNGIYQVSNTLPACEYTFSVYAKIDGAFSGNDNPGVFIRVTDTSDNVLAESERLTAVSSEYIRLIAPFEIASAQSVKVEIMISGRGSVDVDGAQLENNPYANAYNMLENGNFERGTGWSYSSGVSYTSGTRFNMSRSLMMTGNLESNRYTYQNVTVKKTRSTRETFTLSGWANGDKMKATYNGVGQMVAEKWYNSSDELTAHYKYVYDGQGNIVRSIDILGQIEYNYEYDAGKVIRATECTITVGENEFITSKVLVNTVFYVYNEDKLTRKRIVPANGSERVIYYETSDDENTVVKFSAGGRTITSHSKMDSFERKAFDELQIGTGFVSRQFHYHAGKVTEEHKENAKLKSSATTQLVSQIVLSGGRTISYEYDAEERITKIVDSVDGTTEYTYDALGQLLTETVNGAVVNTMTYDNYGNIRTKNGIEYTYGDEKWKDLLTGVGDQSISYDAQGNPISYLGHTLTWEKGRQLKSFDDIQYTYNANGIRTSKTIDGVRHNYILDGSNILMESWDGNVMIPIYDNEESVCGIHYNNEPYYFQKNLQGDIIGIVDKNAIVVAQYSYDAWGISTIVQDSTECGIAQINPYRYRGYYFDHETGLYYLQTRYYDSAIGRFISSDDASYVAIDETVISCNIFAYCKNAPSSAIDNSGCNSASIAQGSYQWAYMLSAVVPAVAAAKAGIIAAIKSALAFLWNVFVVVGLVLLVIILIAAICVTAAKVLTLVQEAVKTNKYKGASGYVVYVLTRKKNKPNRIFYVGRTKNFAKRMKSHQRNKKPCYGYIVVVCKNYAASRAIEQAVLSACIVSKVFAIDKGRIPNGSNRMRGIAKDSVKNFKNNLSDLTSLMSCTSDSDILNLMGY